MTWKKTASPEKKVMIICDYLIHESNVCIRRAFAEEHTTLDNLQCLVCKSIPLNISLILVLNLIHRLITITLHVILAFSPG